jgi:hypothetical protein
MLSSNPNERTTATNIIDNMKENKVSEMIIKNQHVPTNGDIVATEQ